MTFKKHIGHFLVLVMLATQLLLAQHATVHFLEVDHESVHQQDKGDLPAKDKLCQACHLSHDYSKLLAHAGPAFPLPVLTGADTLAYPRVASLQSRPSPYSPRAPPAFSI